MEQLPRRQTLTRGQMSFEWAEQEDLTRIGTHLIEELVESQAKIVNAVELGVKTVDARIAQEELVTDTVLRKGDVFCGKGAVVPPIGVWTTPRLTKRVPARINACGTYMQAAPVRNEAVTLRE